MDREINILRSLNRMNDDVVTVGNIMYRGLTLIRTISMFMKCVNILVWSFSPNPFTKSINDNITFGLKATWCTR